MLLLDTHCVIWLYARKLDEFSAGARALLEDESLSYSPMVMVELDYRFETGRITRRSEETLAYLTDRIGLQPDPVSFLPVAERAADVRWIRDPFDRIIVAQADFRNAGLLTRDRSIRTHFPGAIW